MAKYRIITIFILLLILLQTIMPLCYAISEDENIINEDIEISERENNTTEKEVINENAEETIDVQDKEEINFNEKNEIEDITEENDGISVMSASGYGTGAGNENEFWNAFYNPSVSELTTSQVIRLNSTYTVNHNIRINSSSTSGGNSLHLSSGCGIVVPNGCVLTLDGMVIDGRTWGNDDGKSCITVQNRWCPNANWTFHN